MATEPNHPGMSTDFYERSLDRAKRLGVRCRPVVDLEGTYAVDSSDLSRIYLVVLGTTHSCRCEGHRRHGRCMHRAVAIDFEATDAENAEALAAPHQARLVA